MCMDMDTVNYTATDSIGKECIIKLLLLRQQLRRRKDGKTALHTSSPFVHPGMYIPLDSNTPLRLGCLSLGPIDQRSLGLVGDVKIRHPVGKRLLEHPRLCLLDQHVKHALDVLLLDLCHAGAHADGELAVDDGRREEELAVGVDGLVHGLGALVDLVLGGPVDAQGHQPEARLGEDGEEVRPGLDLGLQGLAQLDAVADVSLEALDAEAPEHEPQLEGAEAAAQGDLPVAVVGDELVVAELVPQVGGLDAQGLDEPGAAADPDGGAVKGGEHPLVRVEAEGVEGLKGRGEVLVLVEEEGRPRVGGVDVDPDLVGGAEAGPEGLDDGLEVVDGAHVGGAERRGEVEGVEAEGAEVGDGGLEGDAGHGEAVLLKDGDGGEADAEDLGGLLCARVGARAADGDELAPQLPHGLLLLVRVVGEVGGDGGGVLFAGGHHVCEDGLAGAAVDDAAAVGGPAAEEALREAEGLGEPVHDDRLELGDGGAADPVEVGAVEGVGVELGERRRVAAGAGEEGHEPRAGPVGDAGEDLGLDVAVDVGPRLRVLGRRGGEEGPEVSGLHVGDDAAGGDILIPVDDLKMLVNMDLGVVDM